MTENLPLVVGGETVFAKRFLRNGFCETVEIVYIETIDRHRPIHDDDDDDVSKIARIYLERTVFRVAVWTSETINETPLFETGRNTFLNA